MNRIPSTAAGLRAATGAFVACLIFCGAAASAPLRFAATEMPRPDPCMPFITETSAWLQKHWPDGVTFRYYTVSDMEKAVQNREVDIVLTEAGIAAMLRRDGARPMLTTVSRRHPNPERSQGSVVFVRNDREDLKTWQDLQHKKLAATSIHDFTGFQAAMGELKTQAREKDMELEHYQRATIAGQISNMFAHEIKQPLHSAACYSHGLLRMLDQGRMNPEQFRKAIERIEEETAAAGQIVDKVRDYARGRRGRDEVVDLRAELEAVVEHESARRGVTMTLEAEGGDAFIKADPLEVRLVFINLLKNAAEAASGGTEPPAVSVSLRAADGSCVVMIRDTG